MFASLRKKLKWGSTKPSEDTKNQTSLLLAAFIKILEEVLFWQNIWLSLSFIIIVNIIFFVCVHRQISFLGFILCFSTTIVCIDAFEAWLKYKHRTTCLKRLINQDGSKLNSTAIQLNQWIDNRWFEFIHLRETNHTKAFLLANITFGIVLFIGKYLSGYLIVYLMCMLICISYKVMSPLLKLFKNIQQDIESDCEFEGLLPEPSDIDIQLLSIEPERNQILDEKQCFDYWKPEDVPLEDASDSSENSSSLVTNFSMEKIQTLQRDAETSDSSEDEYIPLDQQKEQLQSTLEVVEPANSWSRAAYNTFWNFTGAVGSIVKTDTKRKRVSSIDSSDGFEIIDKNDLN